MKLKMHLATLQVLHVQTPVSAKKYLGMKVTVTTTRQPTLQVFVAAKITTSWLTPTTVRVAQVSVDLMADNWVNIIYRWYLEETRGSTDKAVVTDSDIQ